jgi:hypothetical protein
VGGSLNVGPRVNERAGGRQKSRVVAALPLDELLVELLVEREQMLAALRRPWRIDYSRSASRLIASSDGATSISFSRCVAVTTISPPCHTLR